MGFMEWVEARKNERNTPGNPDAPSTAAPLSKIREDIHDRHRRIFRRLPSRGDALPFQGRGVRLPDGSIGGIGRGAPASFKGLEKVTVDLGPGVPMRSVPSIFERAIKSRLAADKVQTVRIRPGLHAIDVAKATRFAPDTPSGARGVYRDIVPHQSRGLLAQQSQMPLSALLKLRAERMRSTSRDSSGTGDISSAGIS